MNVLLDTCSLIWVASDPDALSPTATEVLTSESTVVHVSAISCAEVACLAERSRIALDRHWKVWFNTVIELNEWSVLDIGLAVVEEAYSLPGSFHRDPADRFITATARLHDMSIVTADDKILSYPHVPSIW